MTKPPEFSPTKKLIREYESAIRKIVNRSIPKKPQEQSFAQWLADIQRRSSERDIEEATEFLSHQMVSRVKALNMRTWREAAARSSQSRKLYNLLQNEMRGATGQRVRQLISENAAYIQSIPLEQATKLVDEISKATQRGARPETIAKMARTRWPKLLKSRINLISRTETAKASVALTQARCEELDIQWYAWLTSEDQRVRASHKKMNGVIVPWTEPPDPEALDGEKPAGHYHAGAIYNCRCSQRVILTLDDINFPARVYWQGQVRRMNKQQFKAVAVGLESRAA